MDPSQTTQIIWGSILLLIGLVGTIYGIGRYLLREYTVATLGNYRITPIWKLQMFAEKRPVCTIAYRIWFFFGYYYIPVTGVLTADELASQRRVIFKHPAFWWGGTLESWVDFGHLEDHGYFLKRESPGK